MGHKTIYLTGSTAIAPKKRMFYKIFGTLVVIFSGYQIYTYIIEQNYFEISFISAVVLFCVGLGIMFTGFQIVSKKTNQYIRFDNSNVIYKPSFLKEAKTIDIDSLKEIVFSPTWILCISDKEKFMIDLSWVSSHTSARIKDTLKKISIKKEINIKGHDK